MVFCFAKALVAQLEECQPPKLEVASSNLAERALNAGRMLILPASCFLALGPAASFQAASPVPSAAPSLAWALPVVSVTATDSAKWSVRIVPDGEGGLVLAWEENRGKRMCCRDTRDLYAQRLDAAGAKRWGDTDYQLAADAAGEELEGMAPAAGGGALLIWRRGMGTLLGQELDGDRRPRFGADPVVLTAIPGLCEWSPLTCFATNEGSTEARLAWGQPWEGGSAIRTVRFTRSTGAWEGRGIVEAPVEAGVHPGALVWCSSGRWLLLVWCDGDPVRLDGLWLGANGRPEGKRFTVAKEPAGSYVHVEAAGDGRGGAWAVWAAVTPDHMGKMHRVRVGSIERWRDGGTRVAVAPAGEARTLAMFIPATMVAVGDQPSEAATTPSVAWRATSLVAPAGRDRAILARTDGTRMLVSAVSRSDGRITVGPARALGGTLYTGCAPVLAPLTAGRVALAWAEMAGDGWRLVVHGLALVAGRVRDDGGVVSLEGPPGLSPRAATIMSTGDGALGVAWAGHYSAEHGGVVAQKVVRR